MLAKRPCIMAALALVCASALPMAGRNRAVRPITGGAPTQLMRVMITPVADGAPVHSDPSVASLDLGSVSYAGATRGGAVRVEQKADSYIVSTKFGLTVVDPASRATTASITAFLAYPSRYVIRIDGVKVDPVPHLILAHAPVGRVSVHRLTVEVPNNVPSDASAVINHPIQFAALPE